MSGLDALTTSAARAILKGEDTQRALYQTAKSVLRECQNLASAEAFDKGEYLAAFEIEQPPNDRTRAHARVTNDSDHWADVEFGTRGKAGKAIMHRAVERQAIHR